MVSFKVSDGQSPIVTFTVHKEVVARHSKVLAAAFIGAFSEGRTQEYVMDDVNPGAFRFVMQWFYEQKLDLLVHHESKIDIAGPRGHMSQCCEQDRYLAEAWVFGQKYAIGKLQNEVIDNIIRIQAQCGMMAPRNCHYVYENTAGESPLRRILVDGFVLRDPDQTNICLYPPELVADSFSVLARQLPEHIRTRKQAAITASNYYVTVGNF
jgi:hypothetical protein